MTVMPRRLGMADGLFLPTRLDRPRRIAKKRWKNYSRRCLRAHGFKASKGEPWKKLEERLIRLVLNPSWSRAFWETYEVQVQ